MSGPADPREDALLAAQARALLDAVDGSVARWAAACVTSRWRQWRRSVPTPEVAEAARVAGEEVRARAMPPLRRLLEADVDEQRTNPLSVLRSSVGPVTGALRGLGVPPVERDEQARRLFPDDDYDIGPAAFADLDDSVHEAGVAWGAAKAHVVLRRRRRHELG